MSVEPDAYGREGERSECWCCDGTGMEYGETCVVCAGLGWVRDDSPSPSHLSEGAE